jgi:hypothetical protein
VKEEQEQCEKKRTHGQGRMECEREKKRTHGQGRMECEREKKRTHGQGRMECEREKKSIKGRTGVLKMCEMEIRNRSRVLLRIFCMGN